VYRGPVGAVELIAGGDRAADVGDDMAGDLPGMLVYFCGAPHARTATIMPAISAAAAIPAPSAISSGRLSLRAGGGTAVLPVCRHWILPALDTPHRKRRWAEHVGTQEVTHSSLLERSLISTDRRCQ
jgi:hypothetical protein